MKYELWCMVCQKSVRCHCEVIASIGFYSLSAPGYALVKHFNLGVYKEAPVHSPLRRVGTAQHIIIYRVRKQ